MRMLQLCRPLSGAVSPARAESPPCTARFNCAAPFRERLDGEGDSPVGHVQRLQLCRPLSGAVSGVTDDKGVTEVVLLQLCRPLSGAVSSRGGSSQEGGSGGRFNCAAPFRERLGVVDGFLFPQVHIASIVPPPFGSG